jgi:hypothetical protein
LLATATALTAGAATLTLTGRRASTGRRSLLRQTAESGEEEIKTAGDEDRERPRGNR